MDQILVPLIQPTRLPTGTGRLDPAPRAAHCPTQHLKIRSGKRRLCCFNLAAYTDPDLSKNGKLIDPP
ncbi:MAG TPA: hypothetical protein VED20_05815 [Streptosporangiaceae bacterium]|nr:hypothetical protein [Streptosporangiaceae bacterium]